MAGTTMFQIADLLGCTRPERDAPILQVSGIPHAGPGSIVFATDEETLVEALASGAGAILGRQTHVDARVLVVRDPRTAFARIHRKWFDESGGGGVHSTAVVAESAVLGPGCEVGPGCVIEANVRVGEHCRLGPRVTVHAGTVLGDRVRVQAGAVLGSLGFGYAQDASGHIPFPQIGTLVIGDDVDIGANTTIDRGALGETRIGCGTKIDNLVHIAHNCVIGERVLIAAQVGLAGSITVENDAMLGGQVGLGERVTIGRGVILGGQGGVLPGKTLEGPGVVFWGTPAQPVREYLRGLARLRKG